MNFTFLHCADLHLGSPLLGLSEKDADVAARFASASRDAFSDLIGKAIEAKVAFVLIAGDIYDGEWRDNSIGLFFNREVSRLAQRNIPVFLIKGNHDAVSVVTSSVALPPGVTVFSSRKAETRTIEALRVAIHGRSFPERAVTANWAVDYPAAKAGWFNIGLLHTSCDGRPPHATYAPCSVGDLVARAYDYWALGHVHEYEILSHDPWIVYPGNLQGRSTRECGAKGAVLVDVADGRVIDVRRLIVDRARFVDIVVDVADASREDDVWQAVRAVAAPLVDEALDRLIAARVRLTGATPLHLDILARRPQVTMDVRACLQHLHADLWLERLIIETSEPNADETRSRDLANLDLPIMLGDGDVGDDLRARANELLTLIRGKLPDSLRDEFSADGVDALFAEARALVLGRAERKTG